MTGLTNIPVTVGGAAGRHDDHERLDLAVRLHSNRPLRASPPVTVGDLAVGSLTPLHRAA